MEAALGYLLDSFVCLASAGSTALWSPVYCQYLIYRMVNCYWLQEAFVGGFAAVDIPARPDPTLLDR